MSPTKPKVSIADHVCGKCGSANVTWKQGIAVCIDCRNYTTTGFYHVADTQHIGNGKPIFEGYYHGDQGSEKIGPFASLTSAYCDWEFQEAQPPESPRPRAAQPNLVYLGKMTCPGYDCGKKADIITVGARHLTVCKSCRILRDTTKQIDAADKSIMDKIRQAGRFEDAEASTTPAVVPVDVVKTFKRIAPA